MLMLILPRVGGGEGWREGEGERWNGEEGAENKGVWEKRWNPHFQLEPQSNLLSDSVNLELACYTGRHAVLPPESLLPLHVASSHVS